MQQRRGDGRFESQFTSGELEGKRRQLREFPAIVILGVGNRTLLPFLAHLYQPANCER
jgi:hypothetical protein